MTARSRPGRRGEVLLSLGAVVVVVGLLASAELAARAWSPLAGIRTSIDELHTYSEVYGWEPRKGERFVFDRRTTTINPSGYRGPDLPREKGARTRVVVLGDSIGFGLEVGDDETFSHLLQASRDDVEVANLAVQGYGPDQELIRLERMGLGLKPDVVVVAACLSNDLADVVSDSFLYDSRHPKPFFLVEANQLVKHDRQLALSWRSRIALFLAERSRLYQLLAAPRGRGEGPRSVDEHWLRRRKLALKDDDTVVDLTARLWGRMAELSGGAGASFLVLAFPEDDSFESRSPWLDALAASPHLAGVTIVDMGERFRSKAFGFEDLMLDAVGHLSPAGHKVTAGIVEDVLSENGLIPRRR